MTEEKVKIKELAEQIGMQPREVTKAAQSLKMAVKNSSGSVTLEEAARLRDYLADRKNESIEKSGAKPDVIVRRRQKETPPEPAPAPETIQAQPVAEVPKTEATVAEKPETPPVSPEPGEVKSIKKPVRNIDARVISRPGDVKPEPTVEEKPEPKPVHTKPARPEKSLGEVIREREAAERAKAREEANALRKKMERGASIISKPEVKPDPVLSDEKVQEEIPEPVQTSEPYVSPVAREIAEKEKVAFEPEEPTARTDVQIATDTSAGEESQEKRIEAKEEKSQERVKIISLPTPSPQTQRKPRETGSRPGGDASWQKEQRGSARAPRQPRAESAASFQPAARPVPQPPMPAQTPEGRDWQTRKKKQKSRRTVDFPQGDFGRHAEEDEGMRFNRTKARRKPAKTQPPVQQVSTQPIKAAKRKIRMAEAVRVAEMAQQMGVKANEIIKVLFSLGVMATINQSLDFDTAALVAAEFGYEVEKTGFSEEDYLTPKEEDTPENLKSRPPVVTIMGHVDHGKTSLLDAIRKSNIISGEAGGITQHIGAYHVKTKRGEIVFLDTPGHEAFTAMRARGAQVTDLVILVVAADDGVMEQTREAISHARAANVPIVVAVNKMDKPGADPDRVLRELSELGLQPEAWGGDTIVSKVSAKTREGLDDLLELVALQSEIMDLKANPDKLARGHIVEARLDKGRGPLATVLVQEGTLRLGDNFVCGPFSGRVRALTNDQGKKVKEAGPSLPVEVQGFDGVPEAGEEFLVVADDRLARRIADSRAIKRREKDLASEAKVTLETFLAHHADEEAQNLNLVVKADVQGSLEAITEALRKQNTDKVKINIIHGGTGAISESDIHLASASQAIIIGFNVRPTSRIKDIAEHENVDIRFYDIIYKLVDDVKSAMAGLLAPVQREVYLGQAEVRKVYNLPKIGAIAGSYVSDGKIARNAGVRLLRDGIVTYTGKISSLKRFKEDAREVVKGNECGIGLENFNDIKMGDILEAFETVEEAATL